MRKEGTVHMVGAMVVGLALLLGGCGGRTGEDGVTEGGTAEPPSAVRSVDPETLTPEEKVQWGRSMFGSMCGACHGADGKGGSARGLDRSEVRRKYPTEADLMRRIKEGDPAEGMPPCGGNLTEGELSALAAFIYSLSE